MIASFLPPDCTVSNVPPSTKVDDEGIASSRSNSFGGEDDSACFDEGCGAVRDNVDLGMRFEDLEFSQEGGGALLGVGAVGSVYRAMHKVRQKPGSGTQHKVRLGRHNCATIEGMALSALPGDLEE